MNHAPLFLTNLWYMAGLSASLKSQAATELRALGPNFTPPHHATAHELAILQKILASAVAGGTQPALFFAAGVVGIGALLSLLIPRIGPPIRLEHLEDMEAANA